MESAIMASMHYVVFPIYDSHEIIVLVI